MSRTRSPNHGPAMFERHGFRAIQDGTFRQNGMLLQPTPRWLVLASSAPASADPLSDLHGSPGLWKFTPGSKPGQFAREFHLPLEVLKSGESFDAEPERDLTRQCVEWALATLYGKLPPGWSPPTVQQVESTVPHGRLTLQNGPLIRQGALVCTPQRLAIAFPIVRDVSDRLSHGRLELLRELAIDAQNRWRMVRIGWTGASQSRAIEAEIDLTGAPHSMLNELMRVSLDALRWVVQWIANSAALLADVRLDCRVWQSCASGRDPRKGDESSC